MSPAPRVWKLGAAPCPYCEAPLSGATAVDGQDAPKEGDITICDQCLHALQFGPGAMTFRKLDVEALGPEDRANVERFVRVARDRATRGYREATCERCGTTTAGLRFDATRRGFERNKEVEIGAFHAALRAHGWVVGIATDRHVVYLCPRCAQPSGVAS